MAAKRSAATGQPNAMHSADTVEHYTPPHIVEAARATLGSIDLDPASCELANRTVRAGMFFSKERNGLERLWGNDGLPTRVFCNPPGGKDRNESIQKMWWRHGAREWASGRVDALVWIAFKLDFLQVTQVGAAPSDVLTLDGAVCYPSERIAYYTPATEPQLPGIGDGLKIGKQPPHASAIIYLPSRRDPEGLHRFVQAFSPIGAGRGDPRFCTAGT